MGFTTDPAYSRSTPYCTDLGKAFDVPIFHCNGDDPLSVTTAFEMATDWRQVAKALRLSHLMTFIYMSQRAECQG